MKAVLKIALVCVLGISSVSMLSACSPLAQGKNDFQLKKYHESFEELLPVARQGNATAQYAVGYMYYTGKGVPKDPDLALYWFGRAAQKHEPHAVKALAMIQEAEASEPFPPPSGLPEVP